MLKIKPNCECCNKDLTPDAADAVICTFCRACASTRLPGGHCPNCGGNLVPRPIRPTDRLVKFPASADRVVGRHGFCA